ncbi:MAG: PQQ-dependent sugar dehydrogenase [Actinomycetota bacterium]
MSKLRRVMLAAALVMSTLPVLYGGHASALPRGTRVQTYKGGLAFPVDMAWVPGTKRIFYTEKNSGKIRILQGRKLKKRACANLDVNSAGERGALGIALHPKFKRNHRLYVFYTNASPLENRVSRFKVVNGRCTNRRHIVRGLSAASSGYHNGGQLEFVRGRLFVSTGEAHSPSEAQDRNNRLGKILRYNANGTVPDSNPFGNRNAVWSYGHRNPFGLAHKPGTGVIYQTENGPDCDDEFNIIKKGRNYGWGSGYNCGTAGVGPNPKRPEVRWSNIIVPTDPTYYRGRLRRLSGDVYVGDFGGSLHRLVVGRKGRNVKQDRTIHNADNGLTDVSKGPGGWLYFATSNGILRIVRS